MGFYVPTNKDVKFPKACEQCYFYDGLLCCVLDTYIYDPENKQEDCPLIPIPPHGRLIDADELEASCFMGSSSFYTQSDIDYAPTIIPAVEGE